MNRKRFKRDCVLDDALKVHPIKAMIFEPFVVTELGGTPDAETQTTEFKVMLENIGGVATQTRRLSLAWRGTNSLTEPYPVQQELRTESAAVGIACAVLWHYTGIRIQDVSERGEGFDYWVGEEKAEQGLKIGGTLTANASAMRQWHRNKRDQLFAFKKVGGYVVIVGFARREIILSYHAPPSEHNGAVSACLPETSAAA